MSLATVGQYTSVPSERSDVISASAKPSMHDLLLSFVRKPTFPGYPPRKQTSSFA